MRYIFPEPPLIGGAVRTPIGRWDGPLGRVTAVELGAAAVEAAVARSGLAPAHSPSLLVLGNVSNAGLGMAPAKQVADQAGLPAATIARTVNSVCGSGLAAVTEAAMALATGAADVAVAGGMESASTAPYLLNAHKQDGERVGARLAAYRVAKVEAGIEDMINRRRLLLKETMRYDGLFWPPEQKFMANYAADWFQRERMDLAAVNAAAAESHRRARRAWADGAFTAEIVPVAGVATDDLPTDAELTAAAEAATSPVSPYNSSAPADGAAALVLAAPRTDGGRRLAAQGRLLGWAAVNCAPGDFLAAPLLAVAELQAGLAAAGYGDPREFTLVEANEAFAMQIPVFRQAWPYAAVNVHGGAVALGHPLGASGARLVVTLLHAMQRHGHRKGIATICFGGGGAWAAAVEVT